MADKKPIGVLLVHGIGTAAQGETLIGYSEPLYKWIEKWLKRNTPPASTSTSTSDEDNNHVSVLHADLHPSGDAPAHTEWLLRIKQGNGRKRRIEESHWLLAEAWWAETFSPSSWTQTLKWAIQIAPSLVLRHFIRVVRSVIRDGRKNFLFYLLALPVVPFYIILAIFATFLIQVLALLILIMASITAIIPIAPLKYFVTSMQNIISNFIGDIYLRITSPIQRAAMVSKVKHDLKWLEERCDKIAIVAHSQGSAICYELLKEYKPKKVKRLVTLGQAIKLLKTIESRRWTGLYWAVIIIVDVLLPYLAIQTLVSASKWWQDIADLYVVGRGFFNPDSLWTLVVVVIACAGLGIILWVLAKSLYDYALWNPLTDEKWFELDKEFRWIDLYASNDPAPNGVLAEELPEFIESRPIYNHANLITDHTTYWGNIDEFVTAVFYAVNELTGIKLADLTDDLLKQSRARRKWRVVCLAWVRNLVMLCSVILLWIAAINTASTIQGKTTSHLASIGNGVAEWFMRDFGKLPFVDAISNFMAGLTRSELGKEALGGIVLLTIPLAWYFLASFVWKLWEGADVDRFFKRETRNQNEDDFGGVYFTMLVILVSILILAAIVYYIASVNPSFFNPLAQHGNQIIGTSFYMFVISLILLRWFFSKRFTRGE